MISCRNSCPSIETRRTCGQSRQYQSHLDVTFLLSPASCMKDGGLWVITSIRVPGFARVVYRIAIGRSVSGASKDRALSALPIQCLVVTRRVTWVGSSATKKAAKAPTPNRPDRSTVDLPRSFWKFCFHTIEVLNDAPALRK